MPRRRATDRNAPRPIELPLKLRDYLAVGTILTVPTKIWLLFYSHLPDDKARLIVESGHQQRHALVHHHSAGSAD